MRLTVLGPALCLLGGLAAGQPAPDRGATFDVTSVKPHSDSDPLGASMSEQDGRLQYHKIPLSAALRRAYHIQPQQIMGPSWMNTDTFDFEARYPPGTPDARIAAMVQNLLSERFHLKVHHEQRESPAYTLVLAKSGLKMRRAPDERLSFLPSSDSHGQHLRGQVTLAMLAQILTDTVGRPVFDETRLDGVYAIDFNFSFDSSARADAPSDYPVVFTALEEQLGLRLVPAKRMLDALIVDQVDRAPSPD